MANILGGFGAGAGNMSPFLSGLSLGPLSNNLSGGGNDLSSLLPLLGIGGLDLQQGNNNDLMKLLPLLGMGGALGGLSQGQLGAGLGLLGLLGAK